MDRPTSASVVVHWPKGVKAKGELRSQWHHVVGIAPTILEAAGLQGPWSVVKKLRKDMKDLP